MTTLDVDQLMGVQSLSDDMWAFDCYLAEMIYEMGYDIRADTSAGVPWDDPSLDDLIVHIEQACAFRHAITILLQENPNG